MPWASKMACSWGGSWQGLQPETLLSLFSGRQSLQGPLRMHVKVMEGRGGRLPTPYILSMQISQAV